MKGVEIEFWLDAFLLCLCIVLFSIHLAEENIYWVFIMLILCIYAASIVTATYYEMEYELKKR